MFLSRTASYLHGLGGRLANNRLVLYGFRKGDKHVGVQPLGAIMALWLAMTVYVTVRSLATGPDVNWRKVPDLHDYDRDAYAHKNSKIVNALGIDHRTALEVV